MNAEEFEKWAAFQKKNAGHWVMDRVREMNTGDLFFYNALPSDPARGIFVEITKAGALRSGRFEGAVPHIGEALFTIKVDKKFENQDKAFTHAVTALGLSFLFAVTHGVSPYFG